MVAMVNLDYKYKYNYSWKVNILLCSVGTFSTSHRHTYGNKRCPTPFQYFPYTLMRQSLCQN